jgi:hypothetical protein
MYSIDSNATPEEATMGTRSTIAIENGDGTVTGIYCHWDGYLSHNGRILAENYTDEAAVRELIALGDLSSLGAQIGEKHPFDERVDAETYAETRCTAYGRDRGEKNVAAKTCADWAALLEDFGQEFDYLFVPGTGWQVNTYSGIYNLAAALATETEEA